MGQCGGKGWGGPEEGELRLDLPSGALHCRGPCILKDVLQETQSIRYKRYFSCLSSSSSSLQVGRRERRGPRANHATCLRHSQSSLTLERRDTMYIGVFFFFFLALHLWHVDIPGLGVELELWLPAYTTAMAILDLSHICSLCHSLQQRQILNLLSETRIEPASSWTLCQALNLVSYSGHSYIGVRKWYFFVVVFAILGPTLQHMEVPRLGVESELQMPAYATATAMTRDPSLACDLHHSSRQRWILNPLSKARD